MKKIALLVLFILSSSFAQEYKIEDFLPDSLTTWRIYGSGNFTGNYKDSRDDNSKEYDYNYQLNPQANFRYQRIRKLSENTLNITANYSNQKSGSDDDFEKYKNIQLSTNFKTKYYIYDKLGLSISGFTNIFRSNSEYDIDSQDQYESSTGVYDCWMEGESENQTKKIQIGLRPGISYGRVYDGEYSAKAMELVAELKKSGLLKRELSRAEFLKLSEIILNRKAIYHYDSRIKKLEALNEIASFLKEIGAIDKESHEAAFVLDDIYSYSLTYDSESSRKFGYSIYSSVISEYRNTTNENIQNSYNVTYFYPNNDNTQLLEKYNEKRITTDQTSGLLRGFNIGAVFYKIYNWNLYSSLAFAYSYDDMPNEKEIITKINIESLIPGDEIEPNKYKRNLEQETKNDEFIIRYSISYKFNSRSILTLKTNYTNTKYKHIEEKDDRKYTLKEKYESVSFSPNFQYYITPKFSVNSGVNFYWYFDTDKHEYNYTDYSAKHYIKQNTTSAFLRFGYYF